MGEIDENKLATMGSPTIVELSGKLLHEEEQPLLEKLSLMGVKDTGGKATAVATGFGIFKSIVGGGVLTLPWAFSQAGWVSGLLAQCAVVIINYYTYVVLAYCSTQNCYSVRSYRELCVEAGGTALGIMYDVLNLTVLGLAMLAYVIFIVDCLLDFMLFFDLPDVLRGRQLWTCVIFAVVLLPLSVPTNLNALRYTSILGVLALIYLIVVMSLALITGKAVNGAHVVEVQSPSGLCLFFGISAASYNGQYNCTEFYKELKGRTIKRFAFVTGISFFFILLFNTAVGLVGYFLIGDGVQQNVLNSLENNAVMAFSRLAIGISVTGSYPLLFQSGRRSVMALVNLCCACPIESVYKRLLATVILSATFWILGLFVQSCGLVLSLAQALGGNAISYYLPAYICWSNFMRKRHRKWYRTICMTLWCGFVALFGIAGAIASLVWTFDTWSGGHLFQSRQIQ